jgi:cytochrome b subunit of formate dehydrogenase
MVHVGLVVAVVPLVFGHMYMAILNPTTRVGLSGMVSGFVDREWARHHYSRWYRDHFEDGTSRKP